MPLVVQVLGPPGSGASALVRDLASSKYLDYSIQSAPTPASRAAALRQVCATRCHMHLCRYSSPHAPVTAVVVIAARILLFHRVSACSWLGFAPASKAKELCLTAASTPS